MCLSVDVNPAKTEYPAFADLSSLRWPQRKKCFGRNDSFSLGACTARPVTTQSARCKHRD